MPLISGKTSIRCQNCITLTILLIPVVNIRKKLLFKILFIEVANFCNNLKLVKVDDTDFISS